MDISISTNIFGGADITPVQLDMIKAGGFHVLDFCAYAYTDGAGQGFAAPGWRDWILGIRRQADERGIAFNQTHNAVFNFFSGDIHAQSRSLYMDRIIEATAMLGARNTVCHPVAPPGAEYNVPVCREKNRDFFLRKSDTAQKHGVTLCLENMLSSRHFDGSLDKRYCADLDELVELMDRIDRENVKICLDSGHMHYMGVSAATAVGQLADRVAALHLHDNDTYSDQHLLPFCGTIDWTELMAALAKAGYQGDLTLETQGSFARLDDALLPQQIGVAWSVGEYLRQAFNRRPAAGEAPCGGRPS